MLHNPKFIRLMVLAFSLAAIAAIVGKGTLGVCRVCGSGG